MPGPADPAGIGWRRLLHTAGVTVDECRHPGRAGDVRVLWRVTDSFAGESVTLTAEQWSILTCAWTRVLVSEGWQGSTPTG